MSPDKRLAYHRSMLLDGHRTERLREAIRRSVRPGDVVLDLGTGTGVLAAFAARAGARRVYAIDADDILEAARAVWRANGVDERIVPIHAPSTRVHLPEAVDVVITETIGNFGLEEGILGTVIDARRRFLKPGGTIVPAAVEPFVAPVECAGVHARCVGWAGRLYGLDLGPLRELAQNTVHRLQFDAAALLGEPVSLGCIPLSAVDSAHFAGEAVSRVRRAGTCHGLAGWFRAELVPGLTLESAPPNPAPSWNHAYLPADHGIPLAEGQGLPIGVEAADNGAAWSWRLGREHHSSRRSALESEEARRRTQPDFTPALGDEGAMVRDALALMDGRRPLGDIVREMAARYPQCLPAAGELCAYVRRLSVKFSR